MKHIPWLFQRAYKAGINVNGEIREKVPPHKSPTLKW